MKHTNADALSRNPVGIAADDDDFDLEIQDFTNRPRGAIEATRGLFSV